MFARLYSTEVRLTIQPLTALAMWTAIVSVTSMTMISLRVPGISELGIVASILSILATLMGALLILWVSYWRTMHGQNAALTHSVPVRARTLFAVKAVHLAVVSLFALIWVLLQGAALVVGMAFGSKTPISTLFSALWQVIGHYTSVAYNAGLIPFILLSVVAVYLSTLEIMAALSIGASPRFPGRGFVGPLLALLMLYIFQQIVGALATFFIPWSLKIDPASGPEVVTEGMLKEFLDSVGTGQEVDLIGLGSVIAYIPISIIAIVWAIRSLERHLHVN